MSEINTGGPAFPMSGFDMRHGQPVQAVYQHGMTLRDYFAAKAMQVTLTELWDQAVRDGRPHSENVAEIAAKFSYEVADAMLKARDR